jgi:hypothetical protein
MLDENDWARMKAQGSDETPPLFASWSALSSFLFLFLFLLSLPLICDVSAVLLVAISGPSLAAQELITFDMIIQIKSFLGFMILELESMSSPSGLYEDKMPFFMGANL